MCEHDGFYQQLEAAGHKLRRDEDGVDIFAYEVGHCNGPACVKCGEGWCHHCHREGTPVEPCKC